MFANQVVQTTILIVAAYELFAGNIDLDTCLFYIFICNMIVGPIKDLGSAHVAVHKMVANAKTVLRVFYQHYGNSYWFNSSEATWASGGNEGRILCV